MTKETIQARLVLEEVDPPAGLKANVLTRVEKAIEQRNRNRKIIGFSLLSASTLSCVYFLMMTARALQQSGFSAYWSLIFSDSKIVLANFGSFALSLIDSLPFFAITVMFLSVFIILISIRYATNNAKELSYAL